MVKCHVNYLLVLCLVKESAVLVDDQLVRWVDTQGSDSQWCGLFRLLLLALTLQGMLHEAGVDLCELNL